LEKILRRNKMKKLTWLWLEDNLDQFEDIRDIFNNLQLDIILFKHETPFLNFIKERIQENSFNNYGFILDVLLSSRKYIILPEKWKNEEQLEPEYYRTIEDGHDAGVLI